MNKDVGLKWATALRSNEFKQGKHHLRNQHDEYCCLGVLCELYRQEFGGEWVVSPDTETGMIDDSTLKNGPTIFFFDPGKDIADSQYLPTPVQEWIQLNRKGQINGAPRWSLATLNDDGYSFEFIADVIEENIQGEIDA